MVLDLKHFDEVLKYVNELSSTIDLPSTRVKAEALFHRFQRTVEAADRSAEGSSSGLTIRRRAITAPAGSSSPTVEDVGSSSAVVASKAPAKTPTATAKTLEHTPVISEELRKLLSREVITVEEKPPTPVPVPELE